MRNKIFDIYLKTFIKILELLGVVTWTKKIIPGTIPNQQLVIVNEAKKRGILIKNLQSAGKPTRFFRFKSGKKWTIFETIPIGDCYNRVTSEKVSDKWIVKKILQKAGLPTPEGRLISKLSQAHDFIFRKGYPVVIKPRDESKCIGVTIDIRDPQELHKAVGYAQKYGRKFLIEKFLSGQNYRVTIVKDKVVGVCLRKHPFVVGDGEHTVSQLIQIKNKDPRRGIGFKYTLHPIKTDRFTIGMLKRQKVTLNSKLKKGQIITLSKRINLGAGAETVEMTRKIHPQIAKLCLKVTKLFDANVLGLDILATDISKPLNRQNLVSVIEINPFPFIDMHHFPYEGRPRNVAGAIWDMILES